MIGKVVGQGMLYRKNSGDAGQDVRSAETTIIKPRSSKLISTGLYIAVPKNHVGLLWSRSGLSVKHKVEVGAGCIDFGYTGEVKVHLYNHGDEEFYVNYGDRIAQLLTLPINTIDYEPVDSLEDVTDRGDDGFGSSGVK